MLGSRGARAQHAGEAQGEAAHRQGRQHLHRHGPDRRPLQRMDLQVASHSIDHVYASIAHEQTHSSGVWRMNVGTNFISNNQAHRKDHTIT